MPFEISREVVVSDSYLLSTIESQVFYLYIGFTLSGCL